MALGTYAQLKASLAGWLHRSDLDGSAVGVGVDSITADWITLFEAEANADLRLRMMEHEEALTAVVGSREIDLPTGFLEPLGLWITYGGGEDPIPLRYVPVDQLQRGVTNGAPRYWSIDGDKIVFDLPADQAYAVILRMLKAFVLSDAAPTNWLLTNYPNLYLYGALRHSPMYLLQDGRAAGWTAMYDRAKQLLDDKEARAHALATLSVDRALVGRGNAFNVFRG